MGMLSDEEYAEHRRRNSKQPKYTLSLTNTETNHRVSVGGDTIEELTAREGMMLHRSPFDGLIEAVREHERDLAERLKNEAVS